MSDELDNAPKLLFEFDSRRTGSVYSNLIRVWDNGIYTAEARHGQISYWKIENNILYFKHHKDPTTWRKATTKSFYIPFIEKYNEVIEDSLMGDSDGGE